MQRNFHLKGLSSDDDEDITKKGKPILSKLRCYFLQNKPLIFPNNYVYTTKYTLISFIPKAMMAQFQRYANIYFLIVAILQCFPEISPLHPFSAIAPLVFVLTLSLLRDGFEDHRRFVSDKETNNSLCQKLKMGFPTSMKWKDVQVGDVLFVQKDEVLPADLILLGSSEDEGLCFLETSTLDGETNLKIKICHQITLDHVAKFNTLSSMKEWEFYAGKPSSDLYYFEGHIKVINNGKIEQTITLNDKQLLLRGARLKNTKWIIGAVAYSGFDSRIMRNSRRGKIKQSNIEVKTNKFIIGIFTLQILFSIYGCIHYYFNVQGSHFHTFNTGETYSKGFETFLIFLTWFLLNNTMVPISLIVSLEFVKLLQSFFINQDKEMYVPEIKKSCKVMTSSINEELGQVEYIFTDKTGTLTSNKMEFKLFVVGQILFGEEYLNEKNHILSVPGVIEDKSPKRKKSTVGIDKTKADKKFNFRDYRLNAILKKIEENSKLLDVNYTSDCLMNPSDCPSAEFDNQEFLSIQFFDKNTGKLTYNINSLEKLVSETLLLITSCHDCVTERDPITKLNNYFGPSAEENTLVDTARHFGFVFVGSTQSSKSVEIFGKRKHFELLHVFPFDSNRKRMSVIIVDDGVIKLYMKGADNTVMSLLDQESKQQFKRPIQEYVDQISKKGFRTLCLAMKVITELEWEKIKEELQELTNLEAGKEEKLRKIAEETEKNLILIGAVGIEDKLQDRVPETIRDLLRANIRIWMITGDKLETAENIASSCHLIQPFMSVLRISTDKITENMTVPKIFEEIWEKYLILIQNNEKSRVALLVDGTSIGVLLNDDSLCKKFLEISRNCDSVVCCRVTPAQKAEIVRLIKTKYKKITLAIGDGANDVAMIQEANIGIGIYGQEGTKAVQASDYAIGEFKSLWKLVLVHGRWSYMRTSTMIHYFFYKNMVLTFPQILFSFFSLSSGQTIFDDWYITCYNMIFTALPLIIKAVMDYDVHYKYINSKLLVQKNKFSVVPFILPNSNGEIAERPIIKKNYPLLYESGQKNKIFTTKTFIFWVLKGFFHSSFIFFVNYFVFDIQLTTQEGLAADLWVFSISIFTSIILVVNAKLMMETKRWTSLMILSILISSLGIYFAFVIVMDDIPLIPAYKTLSFVFSSSQVLGSVLLCVGSILTFDLTWMVISNEFSKDKAHLFQILIKIGKDGDLENFQKVEREKAKGNLKTREKADKCLNIVKVRHKTSKFQFK